MTRDAYDVTYQVGNSRGMARLMLYGPNESEARAELYRRGSVPLGEEIIILRID